MEATFFLLWLFLSYLFAGGEGYANYAISANLPNSIVMRSLGWQKLMGWRTAHERGYFASGTNLVDAGTSFQAPVTGLYSLFVTVTISGSAENLFMLGVFINEEPSAGTPLLTSESRNVQELGSLSVFSSVYLQRQDKITICVLSDQFSEWTVLGLAQTTFSITYVGEKDYIPGFSAVSETTMNVNAVTSNVIRRWSSVNLPGLYISQTGFSEGAGTFSALCDGVYQVSFNVKIFTSASTEVTIGASLNGNATGSSVTASSLPSSTFTLSLTVTLKLSRGDVITLLARGEPNSFSVQKGSSFAVVYVNSRQEGFSVVLSQPINGNGLSWIHVPLSAGVTNAMGQFMTSSAAISGGRFFPPQTDIYVVSATLIVRGAAVTSGLMTLESDASALSRGQYGLYTTAIRASPSNFLYHVSLSGLLEAPARQPVSLYINLRNQDQVQVLPGSRVSMSVAQQKYEAFQVIIPVQTPQVVSSNWVELSGWTTATPADGAFDFARRWDATATRYTAGVSGIYYVGANVVFEGANGPISAMVSVNRDTSKQRAFTATDGNPPSNQKTLVVSGAFSLKAGDTMSIFAMTEGDLTWSIGTGTSFSATFIGQEFAVSGVTTVLADTLLGYVGSLKLTGWRGVLAAPQFSTGGAFLPDRGDFTAPDDGLYLVSANIKLRDASQPSSSFALLATVNDDPGQRLYGNGMVDFLQNKIAAPFLNDYYSLNIAGVLSAARGQNISFYVEATGDGIWSVSQDSYMSIALISPAWQGFVSGMQVMLNEVISQAVVNADSWRKIRHWTSTRTNAAQGLFYTGIYQDLDSVSGTISVLESGIYALSVTIKVKDARDSFEIGVFTTNGQSILSSKYGLTSRYDTVTLKLFGFTYLRTGDTFSIQVRASSSGQSWTVMQENSGLSFARLAPVTIPASIMGGLREIQSIMTTPGLWSRLSRLTTETYSDLKNYRGGTVNKAIGFFTANTPGYYLVSAALLFVGKGACSVRMQIGLRGDLSLPGVNISNPGTGASSVTKDCAGESTLNVNQLLALNAGDTIAVYSRTNQINLEVRPPTYTSIQYLFASRPQSIGLSAILKSGLTSTTLGKRTLTGWIAPPDSGFFIHNRGKATFQDFVEFSLSDEGLYLVTANIELSGVLGKAMISPSLNGLGTIESWHTSASDQAFSLFCAGVIFVQRGDAYSVTVYTESDQSYGIEGPSTTSAIYLGMASNVLGFSAQLALQITQKFPANEWLPIGTWSVDSNSWSFSNGPGFEDRSSFVVPETGTYKVTAIIIVRHLNSSQTFVDVLVDYNSNSDIQRGMYSRGQFRNQDDTVSLEVSSTAYLKKWDHLRVVLKTDNEVSLQILRQSTFSIIKLGSDLASTMDCMDSGPKIFGKLSPRMARLKAGESIAWNCFATGQLPEFQWYKDYQPIANKREKAFAIEQAQLDDSGDYVCGASVGSMRTTSSISKVVVFDPYPRFVSASQPIIVRTKENGLTSIQLLEVTVHAESFDSLQSDVSLIVEKGGGGIFGFVPSVTNETAFLYRYQQLDRETTPNFTLQILATNLDGEYKAWTNVTVIVEDENDNPPVFKQNIYEVTVDENATVGTVVVQVVADDRDLFSTIEYFIIPGSSSPTFTIDRWSGIITTKGPLDRETRSSFVLFVRAFDGEFSGYTELYVNVGDVNDNAPFFRVLQYEQRVSEKVPPGSSILQLSAFDADAGANAALTYTIVSGDPLNYFYITDRGMLSNTRPIDYEETPTFSLVVSVNDNGVPVRYAVQTASVAIEILNDNDNKPRFDVSSYSATIAENAATKTTVLKVVAKDPDGDRIIYAIANRNESMPFKMNPNTGEITLDGVLDYEKVEVYFMKVEASDGRIPPLTDQTDVFVYVTDVNDNAPVFNITRRTVTRLESPIVDFVVATAVAYDLDSGLNGMIRYRILSGNSGGTFTVDPVSGAVIAVKPLDYETYKQFLLHITAEDRGTPSLSAAIPFQLTVTVEDVNDNAPRFGSAVYEVSVSENVPVGSTILTMQVEDDDSGLNGEINLYIIEPEMTEVFEIDSTSKTLRLKVGLDYETKVSYDFTVVAEDRGTPTLEKAVNVKIKVIDVNDNAPVFSQSSYATPMTSEVIPDLRVFQVQATDPDPGPRALTYHIIDGDTSNAFQIGELSGIVSTSSRSGVTFLQSYVLGIVAKDSYSPPLTSAKVTLHIRLTSIPALSITRLTKGQLLLQVVFDLAPFSELNVGTYEVIVQRYAPYHGMFNTISSQPPSSWHVVNFDGDVNNNWMRRYITDRRVVDAPSRSKRAAVSGNSLESTIGDNINCTRQKLYPEEVCNGPLHANTEYRLQLRVYETGSQVPIDSQFTSPIKTEAMLPQKSQMAQEFGSDMIAMAAAFCLSFLAAVLGLFIFVCWKQRHEIMHVDHLRERREIMDDGKSEKISPFEPTTKYFSPTLGKISKLGIDNNSGLGLWQGMRMSEASHMLNTRSEKSANYDYKYPPSSVDNMHTAFRLNLAFQDDDGASWGSNNPDEGPYDEHGRELTFNNDEEGPYETIGVPALSGEREEKNRQTFRDYTSSHMEDQEIETVLGAPEVESTIGGF